MEVPLLMSSNLLVSFLQLAPARLPGSSCHPAYRFVSSFLTTPFLLFRFSHNSFSLSSLPCLFSSATHPDASSFLSLPYFVHLFPVEQTTRSSSSKKKASPSRSNRPTLSHSRTQRTSSPVASRSRRPSSFRIWTTSGSCRLRVPFLLLCGTVRADERLNFYFSLVEVPSTETSSRSRGS